MHQENLEQALDGLPLGSIRVYETIGSTNREALAWAKTGAPDLALVTADEQTAGYGRRGSKWYTPKGEALAFSIILNPPFSVSQPPDSDMPGINQLSRLTTLGALAVTETLREEYNLNAKIKWPNDVLVNGCKIAGILAEAQWLGEILNATVIGIGVNVRKGSVPVGVGLDTPANCIENLVGKPVDRAALLRKILENLIFWRQRIFTDRFLRKWENQLAYLGELIAFTREAGSGGDENFPAEVLGLEPDGSLRIRTKDGSIKALNESAYRITPGRK